jgi:hypothetical protein
MRRYLPQHDARHCNADSWSQQHRVHRRTFDELGSMVVPFIERMPQACLQTEVLQCKPV